MSGGSTGLGNARRHGDSSISGEPADCREYAVGMDDLMPESGTFFRGSSLDRLAKQRQGAILVDLNFGRLRWLSRARFLPGEFGGLGQDSGGAIVHPSLRLAVAERLLGVGDSFAATSQRDQGRSPSAIGVSAGRVEGGWLLQSRAAPVGGHLIPGKPIPAVRAGRPRSGSSARARV